MAATRKGRNVPPLESPAIPVSQPRRKRRPTRTPKPSGQKSRLCSPSPFLNCSFHRKKLLFSGSKNDDENDDATSDSENSQSESLEYDPPSDANDSEYLVADDLEDLQHDEEEYDEEEEDGDNDDGEYTHDEDDEYDYHNYDEEKSSSTYASSRGRSSTTSDALIEEMENMNISNLGGTDSLRNSRVSVKLNKKGRPLQTVQTPQLFVKQHTKIKKKNRRKQKEDDDDHNNNTTKINTDSNISAVRDAHKKTVIRITRSSKVFSKSHVFGTLLVKPAECGSGCPLYRSLWKGQDSVTKLMPLWENAEFTKEENVDNALREFEFHADIYRKGCKAYGVKECPVVSIMACVKLKHPVVTSEENRSPDPERTRKYHTRQATRKTKANMVKKPYLAFVMPQLHCNLAQFVSKYRKLTDEEGRRLLLTGVRFLKLLESADIVHCDIKPENIFLDVCLDEEDPVIIGFVFGDFGCAAKTTEEFPYGSLTGTVTMWDLAALVKSIMN